MRDIALRGEIFHVHDLEDISNAIVRDQDYFEHEILDYVKSVAPTHKTIVDVGAMIGNHSVYFARFLRHDRIIAFEPMPEHWELLQLNVGQHPTVETHNVALSNKEGRVWMQRHRGNWGMDHVAEMDEAVDPSEYEKVPCLRLDSFNISDVTLMKIDVEEHEEYVLEGASNTIERDKPLILIEDYYDTYGRFRQLRDYVKMKRWDREMTSLYRHKGRG